MPHRRLDWDLSSGEITSHADASVPPTGRPACAQHGDSLAGWLIPAALSPTDNKQSGGTDYPCCACGGLWDFGVQILWPDQVITQWATAQLTFHLLTIRVSQNILQTCVSEFSLSVCLYLSSHSCRRFQQCFIFIFFLKKWSRSSMRCAEADRTKENKYT